MNKILVEKKLEHYGILGMKWGVRKSRAQSSSQSKADQKWEKKSIDARKSVKAYNAAADRMNGGILQKLNNKYSDKDLKDPKTYDKYVKEYTKAFGKVMNEEADRVFGTNPSGTKRVAVDVDTDGSFSFRFEDIEHEDLGSFSMEVEKDENGFIIKVILKTDSKIVASAFLEHYGILGMKWGVRKSRTASKSSKETSALRKKKAFELTDEELKKVNKRLDLEQRYNQLNPSKLNNAQKAIGKVVGNIAKNVITDVGTRYAKKIIEGTA